MTDPADPKLRCSLGFSVACMMAILALAIGTLSVNASPAVAKDEALLRKFQDEYPEAVRALEAVYSNARIAGREFVEEVSEPVGGRVTPVVANPEWEFLGDGTSVRSIVNGREGEKRVWVVTPTLYFSLFKPAGEGRYTVRDLNVPGQAQGSDQNISEVRKKVTAAYAPFGLLRSTVQELLSLPGYRIRDVTETEAPEGQGTFVRVDWDATDPEGKPSSNGWLLFDPNRSWALQAYEIRYLGQRFRNSQTGEMTTGDGLRHGVLSYEGDRDGVPLLRTVRLWSSGPSGRAWFDQVIEVDAFEPGVANPEAFTLEAFGIRTDPTPRPVPVMWIFFGLSAACSLLVLVIQLSRRRASRSSAPA